MKWFKHKTASLDDPDINALMDEFGDAGYVMFFGLLEIYGREFKNIDQDEFLWLSLKYVARKLRKSSAKTEKFLNYCETELSKTRFQSKINGHKVGIKAPDFIDLASNWTGRQHKKPTEAPTEAPTAPRSRKGEREKEKKKTNTKDAQKVIAYLNEKTGKKFTNTSFILARLNEGKTLEQCFTIIENQSKDEYFIANQRFMNPKTLFRPQNFDNYLNNTPHYLDGKVSDTTRQNIESFKNWEPPK